MLSSQTTINPKENVSVINLKKENNYKSSNKSPNISNEMGGQHKRKSLEKIIIPQEAKKASKKRTCLDVLSLLSMFRNTKKKNIKMQFWTPYNIYKPIYHF